MSMSRLARYRHTACSTAVANQSNVLFHCSSSRRCAPLRHAGCISGRKPSERRISARSTEDDKLHETKLGPNVLAGIREVKENIQWIPATVTQNEHITLDGSLRLLHLSVSEQVEILYGKRIQGVIDSQRYTDSYTMPGQFVGVRLPGETTTRLHAIASSPYESRRDSAYCSASLIEVVADVAQQPEMAQLAPGAQIEVSQVVGRGFCSLLNSYENLLSTMEEQRNILVLAMGQGIVPVRAALNWTPVQAHATARKITGFYVCGSAAQAAFLTEWDAWRDAGVEFNPIYLPDSPSSEDVLAVLDQKLFLKPGSLEATVGCRAAELSVMLAGLTGEVATGVSQSLARRGVPRDQMLFCDFF